MAINQYYLTVLPRQSILRHWNMIPNKVPPQNDSAFYNFVETAWGKELVNFGIIENKILSFVSKVEWTRDFEDGGIYGNNATNDVSIYKDEQDYLIYFSFRIDVVQIDRHFINNILTITKDLDALLLDKQGNLFEPTYENLVDNIKKSKAFSFATNASDFLNKLGNEIEME